MLAALFYLFQGLTPSDDLAMLRKHYLAAALDKDNIESLAAYCNTRDNWNITGKGYCAMTHFLEAKKAINPYKKWDKFNVGRKILDDLVTADTTDIELRYLRHSIQVRVPWFLNYSSDIEKDMSVMKRQLSIVSDSSIHQLIYNYINNTSQ